MNLLGVKPLPNGNVIDLKAPSTYKFTVEEIAIMLSYVKRFNGWGVSVAAHSVWVARTLYQITNNPHIALLGLFHDAQEGYIGDLASPAKDLVGSEWDKLENAVNREILFQLNIKHELNLDTQPIVKFVDMLALKCELEQYVGLGIFRYDDQGVWAETLKNIPTLPNLIGVRDCGGGEFMFAYSLYSDLAKNANVEYIKCSYLALDGRHTCMVGGDALPYFLNNMSGEVC